MRRPITSTAFLLVAATLLAALLPSATTAEIMTHQRNSVVGSTSTSLHKTWGKFIQRQSLMTQSADLPVSDAATNNSRLSTTYRLSKLPCFVRRLSTATPQRQSSPLLQHKPRQSMIDVEWSLATGQIITKIRGGGATNDDDSEEEEYDATDDESSSEEEDEYDSEYDEEYDSEYEDESDDEEETDQQDNIVSSLTSSSLKSSLRSKSTSSDDDEQQIQQYDDVLAPPAMQQLVISLGVMFLSQRIDILDTKTVRIARFAFVAYIVTMQIFLLYVRLRAKAINDRTEITLSNPLASLVQGAAGGAAGGGGNFMVKALADQMLSSTTTIYEYDLSQAKKMNSGLLMPMIFLYFLHFKMKQVQPLLMQTATGVMNLIYSPLFQVYVLGRNLERPFKAAAGNSMMDALQAGQEEESGSGSSSGVEEVEQDDAEEEEDVEEESDTGEEESDGDESEYDTDEE